MHKGEFIGSKAADQPKRILILGESHHISNDMGSPNKIAGREATYQTECVVKEYLDDQEGKKHNLRFFKKIADSFGEYPSLEVEKEELWNRVYFGNYIPVLCGVGDKTAANLIKEKGRREEYNNALFRFVNNYEIDLLFCFSRRVFNALPRFHDESEDRGHVVTDIFVGGKKDYLSACVYKPYVTHGYTEVVLSKELCVYGMRHPSGRGGYSPINYRPFLMHAFRESTV